MAVRMHPEFLLSRVSVRTFLPDSERETKQRKLGPAMATAVALFNTVKPKKVRNARVSKVDVLPVIFHKKTPGVGHVVTELAGKPLLSADALAGMTDHVVHIGHEAYRPVVDKLRLDLVITVEGETNSGETFQRKCCFPADFNKAVEKGEWRASLEIKRGTTLTPGVDHTLFNEVFLRRCTGVVFTSRRELRGKVKKYRYRGYAITGETTGEGDDAKHQRLFELEVLWDTTNADIPLHEPRYVRVDHKLDCHVVREDLGEFKGYAVTPPESSAAEIAVEDDEVADSLGNVFDVFAVLAPFGINQASDATPSAIAAAKAAFSPDFNKARDPLASVMLDVYKAAYSGQSAMALKRKIQPKVRTGLFEAAIEKVEANFLQEEAPPPPRGNRKKKAADPADEQQPPAEDVEGDGTDDEDPAPSEEPVEDDADQNDDSDGDADESDPAEAAAEADSP